MKTFDQSIVDRIIIYLRKKNEWVPEDQILTLLSQAGVADDVAYKSLMRVQKIANIGSIWSRTKRCMQYMWYERKSVDDLAQIALDTF